jgi:hypothetical protein
MQFGVVLSTLTVVFVKAFDGFGRGGDVLNISALFFSERIKMLRDFIVNLGRTDINFSATETVKLLDSTFFLSINPTGEI